MTITPFELMLYAGAIFVLFITPGPVWVAITARAMSGGFAGAWPLAVGVVMGDILWPLLAILGVSWVASSFDGVLHVLRYVAAVIFLVMGYLLIRNADHSISTDSRLTRPGRMAGFLAGVAVILGNPKAILFYMGLLPGFFDLRHITTWDVVAILAVSSMVPLLGNLCLAVFLSKVRDLLRTPSALRRVNIISGSLLVFVGLIIPFV